MTVKFILSEYVDKAMDEASYDKLEDNSFVGKITVCKGVIAFGSTLKECQNELRSTLEDWILLGLKLRHRLPENWAIETASTQTLTRRRGLKST
ncbi:MULTISPECIES: type II toxin-antitoxin system HicB family antitoxin [Microcoleaceae]|uniref:type II toxin-antitoxin system HicB family antitoxin n=1 Tax=Microcoleaceae TaxID=1892252 RepID=UPI001D1353BE|nr:type II toxin-antitoxin system HicB family antitoxin [Tychonema sp. LEGE 06208]